MESTQSYQQNSSQEIKRKADLGNDLLLELHYGYRRQAILYRSGVQIKKVELRDKVEKKLLVTQLVELGAVKIRISEALEISRQSIHNYVEIKKHFGLEGLIHGYTVKNTKNLKEQRKLHSDKRPQGNKAAQVRERRRHENKVKAESSKKEIIEPQLNFKPAKEQETCQNIDSQLNFQPEKPETCPNEAKPFRLGK